MGNNKRQATITDVAKEANVSLGTVSRVMNGAESVNPKLSHKVLIAARKLGFVPKTLYKHLAVVTGRRNPSMPTGYLQVLCSLIEQYAYKHKMSVEIIDINDMDRAIDSRILAVVAVVFSDLIEELNNVPNLPVLTINHPMINKGIHSIYTNHYQQGVDAAKHLIDMGHRDIAILTDFTDEWGDSERLRGYCDVLKNAGITPNPYNMQTTTEGVAIYDTLQRWTKSDVSAIMNFSDDVVPEVIHILTNIFNMTIGGDISTISLEDIPIYQYFSPPQTVVKQPLVELASQAVENIIKFTTGKGAEGVLDIQLEGELVKRDSVADLR
ncbi:MAG: LacI family DNA-binding transcriptional regulator [Kiritimatiellae bacterium]|jgi:DNA-binding LacI/PurR family transcriptional regulator|nr:LacI family DNA-binding transcriptional regulator [Kiritimatiellia bacterium]